MVEHGNLAGYLLESDLLEPGAVLDGDLVIRDASSRNHVYRVETTGGPSYLVKQPATDDGVWSVANEANVYELVASADVGLARYLPAFYGYDSDERLLVLELLSNAEDLRRFHMRTGRFSPAVANLLGSALGVLHRNTSASEVHAAPRDAAWILWVDRPDARLFRDVSAAGLQLIRVVQGAPGFSEALERLRTQWVPSALIHGDLKWDNCLSCVAEDGRQEVRLVDWESAAVGDPCWDIGSALSQYLSFWLFSIPVTGPDPPDRFYTLAQYPLGTMKAAMSSCWSAYTEARELDPRSAAAELIRAVGYAGARLIQTAFEASQMMQWLTSSVVLHLQVAHNMLDRPQEAAAQLMGISPIGSAAR